MAASKFINEEQLKRLLYTSTFYPKYVAGDPDKHILHVITKNSLILEDSIKNNLQELLNVIQTVSEDKLLPRRSTIFYVLARAINSEHTPAASKPQITETVLKMCKSDKDFFDFIRYCSYLRRFKNKLPNSVIKAVKKFYNKKTALDLSSSYASCRGYHSWSHKDLIKYGHVKSDTPLKNIVINYILFKKLNDREEPETKKVMDIVFKSEIVRGTKDDLIAVPIVNELKLNLKQVNPELQKSAEIWNATLPQMTVQEILKSLPKLYKLGFLKPSVSTQSKVTELLTNPDKIKSSKIHPVEVFIHMRNYEKGGKPLDPKLIIHLVTEKKVSEEDLNKIKTRNEPKCPVIKNCIQKCLSLSYNNISSSGKRFMITVDVTPKMDTPCLANKNITGLEAALAYTLSILKTEKDVTVAVFKDKEILVVNLDKGAQFQENLTKLRSNKSDYLVLASPIEWANSKKKHVDIFINFVHHPEFHALIPKELREKTQKPVEALSKYRKKVNLQNAKLITFCMSSPNLDVADGSTNMLDIAGFDGGVPKVVEAFCKGSFS